MFVQEYEATQRLANLVEQHIGAAPPPTFPVPCTAHPPLNHQAPSNPAAAGDAVIVPPLAPPTPALAAGAPDPDELARCWATLAAQAPPGMPLWQWLGQLGGRLASPGGRTGGNTATQHGALPVGAVGGASSAQLPQGSPQYATLADIAQRCAAEVEALSAVVEGMDPVRVGGPHAGNPAALPRPAEPQIPAEDAELAEGSHGPSHGMMSLLVGDAQGTDVEPPSAVAGPVAHGTHVTAAQPTSSALPLSPAPGQGLPLHDQQGLPPVEQQHGDGGHVTWGPCAPTGDAGVGPTYQQMLQSEWGERAAQVESGAALDTLAAVGAQLAGSAGDGMWAHVPSGSDGHGDVTARDADSGDTSDRYHTALDLVGLANDGKRKRQVCVILQPFFFCLSHTTGQPKVPLCTLLANHFLFCLHC